MVVDLIDESWGLLSVKFCCYCIMISAPISLTNLRSKVCVTKPAAAANTYVYEAVTVEELDLSSSDSEDDRSPAAAGFWPSPSLPGRARAPDRPAAAVTGLAQSAPRFRTRPCIYYQQGTCNRGDQCTYSHNCGSPAASRLHPDVAFKAGPAHSHPGPQGAPPQAQGPLRSFLSRFSSPRSLCRPCTALLAACGCCPIR